MSTSDSSSGLSLQLRELFIDNPMLEEGRRAQRKFFTIGRSGGKVVMHILIGLILVFYLWFVAAVSLGGEDVSIPVLYFGLVVCCLVLPGSIYAAISGEREKATWDALILTRLTPSQIIVGKLMGRLKLMGVIAAVVLVPILISHGLHAHSIDVSTFALVEAFAMVLAWGLLVLTFGLWISSITRRSITSIAFIAAALLGILLFIPILMSLFDPTMSDFDHNGDLLSSILRFNPFTGITNVLFEQTGDELGAKIAAAYGWGGAAIAAYLLGSIVFVGATGVALRRLEEARRR